jgi:hypothetical protein
LISERLDGLDKILSNKEKLDLVVFPELLFPATILAKKSTTELSLQMDPLPSDWLKFP